MAAARIPTVAAKRPMTTSARPRTEPSNAPPVSVATAALAPAEPRWNQWALVVWVAASARLSSTRSMNSTTWRVQSGFTFAASASSAVSVSFVGQVNWLAGGSSFSQKRIRFQKDFVWPGVGSWDAAGGAVGADWLTASGSQAAVTPPGMPPARTHDPGQPARCAVSL